MSLSPTPLPEATPAVTAAHGPQAAAELRAQFAQLTSDYTALCDFLDSPAPDALEAPRLDLANALKSLDFSQKLDGLQQRWDKELAYESSRAWMTLGIATDHPQAHRRLMLELAELPQSIQQLLLAPTHHSIALSFVDPLADELPQERETELADATGIIIRFHDATSVLPLIHAAYEPLDLGIRPATVDYFRQQFPRLTPPSRPAAAADAYQRLAALHATAAQWTRLLGQVPRSVTVESLAALLASPAVIAVKSLGLSLPHATAHALTWRVVDVDVLALPTPEAPPLDALLIASDNGDALAALRDARATLRAIPTETYALPLTAPTTVVARLTTAVLAWREAQQRAWWQAVAAELAPIQPLCATALATLGQLDQCRDHHRTLHAATQTLREQLIRAVRPLYERYHAHLADATATTAFVKAVAEAAQVAKQQSPIPPVETLLGSAQAAGAWLPVVRDAQTQLRRALTRVMAQELNRHLADTTAALHRELATQLFAPLLPQQPLDRDGLQWLANRCDVTKTPQLHDLLGRLAAFQLSYDEHFYYRTRGQLNYLDALNARDSLEFEPLHEDALHMEDAQQLADGLNSHYREAIYHLRTQLETQLAADAGQIAFALVERLWDALESDPQLAAEWRLLIIELGPEIWPTIYDDMATIRGWCARSSALWSQWQLHGLHTDAWLQSHGAA